MLTALLLLAVAPPVEVTLTAAPARLSVTLSVREEPPADWLEALAGGAPVSITYRIRLFRNRRWLWDRRLSGHELVVGAQRDPLTGVFSLDAKLDGEILASGQAGTLAEATQWMTNPPVADIPVPLHHEPLWFVVRAEFLTRYKLLVIPTTVGTDWVTRAVPESP